MSYRFFRDLLFMLPAEVAHNIGLRGLSFAADVGVLKCFIKPPAQQKAIKLMGIHFPNQVGLAAGLDKNAEHIAALSQLGFGFVEIGTVTPKPQVGNPKPRLFRLPEHSAIINRMGFNNVGVEQVIKNISKARSNIILGINIGKNAITPVENAASDYLTCMQQVYDHADYITVNISSPNTTGLRSLQLGDMISALLSALKEEQYKLSKKYNRYVPLVVKIAPDLTYIEITSIAHTLVAHQLDGVIATNTTISREGVDDHSLAIESGGLSGKPLFDRSTKVVAQLFAEIGGKLPIIAAGGIMSSDDAVAKIRAGASLVQIYTGMIYNGPSLINKTVEAISKIA